MITDAMEDIRTLTLDETKRTPELNISVRKDFGWIVRNDDGLDFQIGISGQCFEAYRNCNRDELIAIRDWINEALAASETENV